MALFKYAGTADDLATKKIHDGYVYICSEDDPESYERGKPLMGEWFVDIGNARYRLAAAALIDANGEVVDIDDLVQSGDILEIAQGGTGKETLVKNAILLGNGTEPVQELAATAGALMVDANGEAPTYGTIPIKFGGSGGTTVASARTNLEVDSSIEVNAKVDTALSNVFTGNLVVANWNLSNGLYYNTIAVAGLTCGRNRSIPPLVAINDLDISDTNTLEAIQEAYSLIEKGTADPASNPENSMMTFVASEAPVTDIPIIIVDNR